MRNFLSVVLFGVTGVVLQAAVFEPKVLDFGVQGQHKILNFSVVLHNDSTRTLDITDIQSDCGCTLGSIASRQLAPGEKTELKLDVKTLEYRGLMQRQVTLITNQGKVTLPIRGTVNPYGSWEVSPTGVNFEPTSGDKEDEQTVSFSGGKVTGFWTPFNWMVLSSPKANVVIVRRIKDAPAGTLNGFFKVSTDDPKLPELTIPVFAAVKSELSINPTPLAMGTTRQGMPKSIRFSLEGWRFSEPPVLKSTQGSIQMLNQESEFIYYTLTLPGSEVGLLTTEVYLYHGSKLLLTVPVVLRVLPAL